MARLTLIQLRSAATALMREALKMSFDLFKIMVPMSIFVRLLEVLGLIEYLGIALEPVMELMGLPGSMGMVWAAGMASFYAGIATFTSLAPSIELTVAQVTILFCLLLLAHSLPVELRIAQKAGARIRAMFFLRVGGAFAFGWGLNKFYRILNILQNEFIGIWTTAVEELGWREWAMVELRKLLMIFMIVLTLIIGMKLLHKFRVTAFLTRLLEPILSSIGISERAAPIAIVGMTLGLTYGGGLIIQEFQSGKLERRDVFSALTLMGLSHSLIEDTVFLLAIGGHISGVLWGRLFFTFITVFTISKLLRALPENVLDRYFFRKRIRMDDAKELQ